MLLYALFTGVQVQPSLIWTVQSARADKETSRLRRHESVKEPLNAGLC